MAELFDPLPFDHLSPLDNPNSPDDLEYTNSNINKTLPPILEVDMDAVWDRIRQARPYALVDLPEETVSQSPTHVVTEDSESTSNPPTTLSTDSEREVEYNPATYGLTPNAFVREHLLVKAAKQAPHMLAPDSQETIMDFKFFVQQKTSLLVMFWNPFTYKKLLYRARHLKDGETIKDVFDGLLYESLCQTCVSVDGKKFPFKHFEDFSPDVHMHQDNIICVGAVPGPHSPKDINLFLQPLIDELAQLAKGVEAVDVVREEIFSLRAHLIAAGGDLPAISPTANKKTHLYCPLHRLDGNSFDPLSLPLCTHDKSIAQGYHVLEAPNNTARANRATECGIKGVTLLARLSSIRIPNTFPVEVMHMIWINLIPQLMDLWQENFNELDSGMEDYGIDALLVNSLGTTCAESGALFPSSFGCRVPHFRNRSHFTAESWSIWAVYLAPHLLRGRFKKSDYYTHFVRLINILREVMDYEIAQSELLRIRKEIAGWLEDFEIIYYQYNEERLRIQLSAWVHFVGAAVKSRRFPYANIARRLLDVAQLRAAREIYNLHESITFGQTRASTERDKAIELAEADRITSREYEHILLLTPRSESLITTPSLRNKINKYIATAFGVTMNKKVSSEIVPDQLKQWGRIRIIGGGDLIHARGYHKLRPDGRNASFIRYEQMVDTLAHRRRAVEDLDQTSCYGQLWHVFRLDLPPKTIVNKASDPKVLLLALVYEAPIQRDYSFEYSVISYSGELSSGEVIDASTIACAVGRVKDKKRWWIIDRSSGLGDIEFVD
ncbi:hypothetical protein BN14_08379 [Rhizoctonia solani AG-1 IB]|uniref:Uncharacterized protein n=1 Tax=Thanatephorus cucumeris (strain AG1-IB / isolate 7/3/14) TaxID=1108050 RepID=M5C4N4_THACB|nr:hypothetical protein BN14_08379 [Rhizoctonia solani AG-1 IB]